MTLLTESLSSSMSVPVEMVIERTPGGIVFSFSLWLNCVYNFLLCVTKVERSPLQCSESSYIRYCH